MDSKIVWDKEDPSHGYKHLDDRGSKELVYKRSRAIAEFMYAIIHQLVQYPLSLQNVLQDAKAEGHEDDKGHEDDGWSKTSRRIGVHLLGRAEPKFSFSTVYRMMETIVMPILTKLKQDLLKLDEKDELSDFTFLLQLGLKRNWKQECAICLGDKVGRVCDCGHTQTVISRPCGHAFCEHCLTKSETKCPMCRSDCSFFLVETIRVPKTIGSLIDLYSAELFFYI